MNINVNNPLNTGKVVHNITIVISTHCISQFFSYFCHFDSQHLITIANYEEKKNQIIIQLFSIEHRIWLDWIGLDFSFYLFLFLICVVFVTYTYIVRMVVSWFNGPLLLFCFCSFSAFNAHIALKSLDSNRNFWKQ